MRVCPYVCVCVCVVPPLLLQHKGFSIFSFSLRAVAAPTAADAAAVVVVPAHHHFEAKFRLQENVSCEQNEKANLGQFIDISRDISGTLVIRIIMTSVLLV